MKDLWMYSASMRKTSSAGSLQLKIQPPKNTIMMIDLFYYSVFSGVEDSGGTSATNVKGYMADLGVESFYVMKDNTFNNSIYPNKDDILFFGCMSLKEWRITGNDYITFLRSYKAVDAVDVLLIRGRLSTYSPPITTLTGGTLTNEFNNIKGVIE